MSTLHEMDGKVVMVTKGAVDVICDRVASIQKKGEEAPFTPQDRKELARMNQYFSEDGLRVLAFAYKVLDRPKSLNIQDEKDLTFLGLIAMMDPPRPESKQAVAKLSLIHI